MYLERTISFEYFYSRKHFAWFLNFSLDLFDIFQYIPLFLRCWSLPWNGIKDLKKYQRGFNLKWSNLNNAAAYQSGLKQCNICLISG